MTEKVEQAWATMRKNDSVTNEIVLCGLIDLVAGQSGKKGYELIQELYPILRDVGEEYGTLEEQED